MRHFYSWFVWSWQWEQPWSPLLSRFQPESLLRMQVCSGSWVMARGILHSAIGHHPPCTPASPNSLLWLNPSIRSDHLSGQKRRIIKVFWACQAPKSQEQKTRQQDTSSNLSSSWQHTVSWWSDYVFTLSMNMKHPSRFNPALLSHSVCPIVELISAAGS